MKVYPALNIHPDEEALLIERLDALRGATDMAHLDICDGTFTDNVTWANPQRWQEIAGEMKLQAHLMVSEPEAKMIAWLDAGAVEIIIHTETLEGDDQCEQVERMRVTCNTHGARLIVAGTMETPVEELTEHGAYADALLLLTVKPGRAGQQTDRKAVLERIDAIRLSRAGIDLWIDGDVNRETLPSLRAYGANVAVAASAVWTAEDPARELAALQLL